MSSSLCLLAGQNQKSNHSNQGGTERKPSWARAEGNGKSPAEEIVDGLACSENRLGPQPWRFRTASSRVPRCPSVQPHSPRYRCPCMSGVQARLPELGDAPGLQSCLTTSRIHLDFTSRCHGSVRPVLRGQRLLKSPAFCPGNLHACLGSPASTSFCGILFLRKDGDARNAS